jgi:hypothetical protein
MLVEVCKELASDAVVRSGGRIETDNIGRKVFVIPVKKPTLSRLEQSFRPGPISKSHFSAEQMSRITVKPEKGT